ncbi:MAG: HigA family addiction module antitoxin [Enterobacteriaceae bacterium]
MTMHNPPHPGELIQDTLDELNVTVTELARHLDVETSTIHRVVSGKSAISPEMAIRLSIAIGSSPRFWLALQDNYNLWQAQQKMDTSRIQKLKSA